MTLTCHKFEFSENFADLGANRTKIDPYCQRRSSVPLEGIKQGWGGKTSYFRAKCVNISKMVGDAVKVTINHY